MKGVRLAKYNRGFMLRTDVCEVEWLGIAARGRGRMVEWQSNGDGRSLEIGRRDMG